MGTGKAILITILVLAVGILLSVEFGPVAMWVIIGMTTVWAVIDAVRHQRNPVGTFLFCALLWIIGFPYHLAHRNDFAARSRQTKDAPGRELPKSAVNQSNNDSRLEKLERLARLRDSGALTEDEFQVEKRKLA